MHLLLDPIASSLEWPLTCLDAGKRTFLRMKSATDASKLLVIPFDPLLETATSIRLKVRPKSVKLKLGREATGPFWGVWANYRNM